eukprot:jgi/Galph1/413/GphlegSOOS_G5192.1
MRLTSFVSPGCCCLRRKLPSSWNVLDIRSCFQFIARVNDAGTCVSPGLKLPSEQEVEAIASFIKEIWKMNVNHGKLCVISGAGISTASGIPDYRSPGRPPHKPITHDQFVSNALYRKRYWARSYVGYERLSKARPSESHISLTLLDRMGLLSGNVTQNVDGLLLASGIDPIRVVELHGNIHFASCLKCGLRIHRNTIQKQLTGLNVDWRPKNIQDEDKRSVFERPDESLLKPDVVFFGGSVPAEVSSRARHFIEQSNGVLVLGSSLSTFSAYGLVQHAVRQCHLPVAIVNFGATRADDFAALKYEVDIGQLMSRVAERLMSPSHLELHRA